MSQGDQDQGTCASCGAELRKDDRFCRSCGAQRARAQSAPPESYAAQPWPAGYVVQSPAGSPPPGPPPGYVVQPMAGMPAGSNGSGSDKTAWVVAGVAVAILVVIGIGVGVYFAASSGGGGQARLLTSPTPASVAANASPSPSPSSSSSGSSYAGGGSAAARTGRSSGGRAGVENSSTPAEPRASISQSSEKQAIADTIQRHFSLIQEHQFSAAYAMLAPSLQSGESAWVQSHREDGIYQVSVAVDTKLNSSDSATATIVKMQTLDGHGCKRWTGSWGLSKIGGQWRISESNLSFTSCKG